MRNGNGGPKVVLRNGTPAHMTLGQPFDLEFVIDGLPKEMRVIFIQLTVKHGAAAINGDLGAHEDWFPVLEGVATPIFRIMPLEDGLAEFLLEDLTDPALFEPLLIKTQEMAGASIDARLGYWEGEEPSDWRDRLGANHDGGLVRAEDLELDGDAPPPVIPEAVPPVPDGADEEVRDADPAEHPPAPEATPTAVDSATSADHAAPPPRPAVSASARGAERAWRAFVWVSVGAGIVFVYVLTQRYKPVTEHDATPLPTPIAAIQAAIESTLPEPEATQTPTPQLALAPTPAPAPPPARVEPPAPAPVTVQPCAKWISGSSFQAPVDGVPRWHMRCTDGRAFRCSPDSKVTRLPDGSEKRQLKGCLEPVP